MTLKFRLEPEYGEGGTCPGRCSADGGSCQRHLSARPLPAAHAAAKASQPSTKCASEIMLCALQCGAVVTSHQTVSDAAQRLQHGTQALETAQQGGDGQRQ